MNKTRRRRRFATGGFGGRGFGGEGFAAATLAGLVAISGLAMSAPPIDSRWWRT